MTSSFERARLVVGSLLIVASVALGAGPEGWQPLRPEADDDAPALAAMHALPRDAAAERVATVEPALSVSTVSVEDSAADKVPAAEEPLLVLEGSASWYADALAGRSTASGEPYDPSDLIAAHRALPFGTRLRVTNLANGRVVEVRVIDRGPFIAGRILDLSRSAAEQIGILRAGHGRVRVEVLEYGE